MPASADYADKMHSEIKICLKELFGESADQIPVLYGGSVNIKNASELIIQKNIDGLFVGRSAWDAEAFGNLIREALTAVNKTRR